MILINLKNSYCEVWIKLNRVFNESKDLTSFFLDS